MISPHIKSAEIVYFGELQEDGTTESVKQVCLGYDEEVLINEEELLYLLKRIRTEEPADAQH